MTKPWTLVIGPKRLSSWSLRPWLALKQAGLPFDEISVRYDTPERARGLLAHSATGKVPVLVTDRVRISESLAICEYAAEHAPDLWPRDRERRAHARAISHEMHAGFAPLREHLSMQFLVEGVPYRSSAAVERDIARIRAIWSECRERYAGEGSFLFGPFTIADAMFAPVVSRFRTYGVALESINRAYADAVWELPAMQEWLAGARHETAA